MLCLSVIDFVDSEGLPVGKACTRDFDISLLRLTSYCGKDCCFRCDLEITYDLTRRNADATQDLCYTYTCMCLGTCYRAFQTSHKSVDVKATKNKQVINKRR